MKVTLVVWQTALTCCTISSTLIHQLRLTILHHIQTLTTTVSLLQLVNGEYRVVDLTINIMLSASQSYQVAYYQFLFTKE